ncbi:MAG: hypothetical protein JNG90_00050, partial [Planctomycetaceae bacterium]|nr:hypothetical protein [Planctomycetaceae bacterium]
MKFEAFEARLNELLDQRQGWDADPEVARLIRDSAEHRAWAVAYGAAVDRQTLDQVAGLPDFEPPSRFSARVLAALRAEASPQATAAPLDAALLDETPLGGSAAGAEQVTLASGLHEVQRPIPGWLSVAMAIAATLLLAMGLAQLAPDQSSSGVPVASARVPAGKPTSVAPDQLVETLAPATAESEDPPIGTLMSEARNKYADLARDTQQAVAEVAVLLPGFGNRAASRHQPAGAAGPAGGVASDAPHSEADWAGSVGD